MFGFDDAQQNYQDVQNYQPDCPPEHKAKFSHEFIGGAAAFGAMKMFEDRQRAEGKPVSHQFAKELLAGLAGAEIDRFAETHGEDFVDRERAKHEAKKRAEHLYDQHYGDQDQYDPNNQDPPQQLSNW